MRRTTVPARIVATCIVTSLISMSTADGANRALLYGIDYGPKTENWHREATQIELALTTWKNEWPLANVTKGPRKATTAMINAALAGFPALAADDFFLFYYSGHGGLDVPQPPNETCVLGMAPPAPDGGAGMPGPALNRPCDETLVPFDLTSIRDDKMLSHFTQANLTNPKKFAIHASCFSGGHYLGNDIPPSVAGDLEQEGSTALLSGVSENELMSGANDFNQAIVEAFEPVLVGTAPNEKWRPKADNVDAAPNGKLTLTELWNFVKGQLPQGPAPRYGPDKCACHPPLRGQTSQDPGFPRGKLGKFNPRFFDGGIGGTVVAEELPKADLVDSDGDGLYDHQEPHYGTNPGLGDTDEDGLSDFEELTEEGTDPTMADTDGDGEGDATDCAPLDPDNAAPTDASGVVFESDKNTISWIPAVGAETHDVVRGDLHDLPVGPGFGDEICIAEGVDGVSADGTDSPPVGLGYWYLVRGTNECGDGTYGESSGFVTRDTVTCP